MATRQNTYDPTKITVYPDNSTVCAAFKAHRNQADAAEYSAYLPLRDWFERVACEANLCLSMMHLGELFRWDDHDTADAIARWYDTLPVLWMKSMYDDMEEFEAERWTAIAAGVEVEPNAKPFATTLLTSFRSLSVDAVAALLAQPLPSFAIVKSMRESSEWHQRFQAYNEVYIGTMMDVWRDHQWADAQGWTDDMKRKATECNVRVALRERARDADKRLTSKGNAAYAAKECRDGDVQDRLVELYQREPKAMPLFRVIRQFNEGANAHVERGQIVNGQPSKSLRKTLLSSFGDWMHLVGAAYCDVFTCDGTVSGWLGDVRVSLGLRPQLASRGYMGGPEAFVRDLMATWP
jgi:hypothetical protein